MEVDGIEILWIEMRLNKKILLRNIRRPPNADGKVLSTTEVMMEKSGI